LIGLPGGGWTTDERMGADVAAEILVMKNTSAYLLLIRWTS